MLVLFKYWTNEKEEIMGEKVSDWLIKAMSVLPKIKKNDLDRCGYRMWYTRGTYLLFAKNL
jgi:hypothetical protein